MQALLWLHKKSYDYLTIMLKVDLNFLRLTLKEIASLEIRDL